MAHGTYQLSAANILCNNTISYANKFTMECFPSALERENASKIDGNTGTDFCENTGTDFNEPRTKQLKDKPNLENKPNLKNIHIHTYIPRRGIAAA